MIFQLIKLIPYGPVLHEKQQQILCQDDQQKPKTSACKDSNDFCCVFAPTAQATDVDTLKKSNAFCP